MRESLITTELVEIALLGLVELHDPQSHLFSYQIKEGRRERIPIHLTFVHSAISALGLFQAKRSGWPAVEADEAKVIAATVELIDQREKPGDIGLLLWADAKVGPSHSQRLLDCVGKLVDPRGMETMSTSELSWLLTGLCYLPSDAARISEIESWAFSLGAAIQHRQSRKTDLFTHRMGGIWPASIRNQIGNFADQIFAVYALATFHERFERTDALACCVRCARRLCEFQGPAGQWWCNYHARHGLVAARYPVYSVHQDGMAPMALIKLSQLSGEDFRESTRRGISWLFGANELRRSLIDPDRRIVWREIQLQRHVTPLRYAAMLAAELGMPKATELFNSASLLKRSEEMYSHHLGWLLYALADPGSRKFLYSKPDP